VKSDAADSSSRGGGAGTIAVLREALLLAAAGLSVALAANAISPRGLSLHRNYFPGSTNGTVAPVLNPSNAGPTNSTPASADALAARIRERGFQVADRGQVLAWFRDTRYAQDGIVFIDARNGDHFRAGHIPGAHELDPYHPELEIAAVLPLVQAAESVVIYCTGGDCEDSQFAATLLAQAGVPKNKLSIYAGGISDWRTNGLPVEIGERHSGNIQGGQ
jgi:rhodanese-related sulfurtransferase